MSVYKQNNFYQGNVPPKKIKSSLKKMKGTPLKEESVIVRAQRSIALLKRPASNIVLIGQNIGQKHQLLYSYSQDKILGR